MQRTWTPPKSIKPSLLDDLLLMLGTQLEENVHSGNHEPSEQADIDPETFCQIPFREMTFRQFSHLAFIPKKIATLAEYAVIEKCRHILASGGILSVAIVKEIEDRIIAERNPVD